MAIRSSVMTTWPIAWLVSQFALPGPDLHQCVAISRTGDPVAGGWFLYDFHDRHGQWRFCFSDYPKSASGRTPTTWARSVASRTVASMFGPSIVTACSPDCLPASPIPRAAPSLFLIPSDLNGTAPPAKTPNTFARHVDGQRFGGYDRLELFDFHVDWMNPASSTFGLSGSLPTAPFDTVLCESTLMGRCIPQPGQSPPGIVDRLADVAASVPQLRYA
jgi:hypothetical protein